MTYAGSIYIVERMRLSRLISEQCWKKRYLFDATAISPVSIPLVLSTGATSRRSEEVNQRGGVSIPSLAMATPAGSTRYQCSRLKVKGPTSSAPGEAKNVANRTQCDLDFTTDDTFGGRHLQKFDLWLQIVRNAKLGEHRLGGGAACGLTIVADRPCAQSMRLNACGVLTSGFGTPARIATPSSPRATITRVVPSILPASTSASTSGTVRMATVESRPLVDCLAFTTTAAGAKVSDNLFWVAFTGVRPQILKNGF